MAITTLWYTRCPAPTAATIAIRQGWLEEEFAPDGIRVRSLTEASDPSVRASHYNQTHPNTFRFGGYVPPLVSMARGADLKVVAISWHDRVHGFFSLPESGIRTAEDLKGKRLSVPVRLNDEVDWWRATVLGGYQALLDQYGLDANDVTLVEIPIERRYMEDAATGTGSRDSLWGARSQFSVQTPELAALYRGEVDAVYSDGAMGAIFRSVSGAILVAPLKGNEDEDTGFGTPCLLTVSGQLCRDRPDLVARWIRRHFASARWTREHQQEARSLFARETGLPEDFLGLGYSERLLAQIDLSLAPGRVALLESKIRHLYHANLLETPIDVRMLVDPTPLELALKESGSASNPVV